VATLRVQWLEMTEHSDQTRTQNLGRHALAEPSIKGLRPWTGSWTGPAQNPRAASAIRAIARGIGAASGHAAG
jgi:hypothetical protein